MRRLIIALLDRFGALEQFFAVRRRLRHARQNLSSRRTRRQFERVVSEVSDGFSFVHANRRWWIAQTVDAVRVDDVRDRNFEKLVRICAEAELDYFVVPTGSVFRTAIGVPTSQRDRAIDALASAEHEQNWYASAENESFGLRPFAALDLHRWRERALTVRAIETYSVVASREGLGIVGRGHRCELQFWRPSDVENADAGDPQASEHPMPFGPSTVIRAPRPNPCLRSMPLSRAFEGSVCVAGREQPTAPEFQWFFGGASCPFDIDVVYTWVDSGDPAWLKRRSEAAGASVVVSADGSTDERFRTFDELRYSLRSVRQYVPYVRKIFIVTDRQIPPWLDVGHENIEIVDHRDIFDDLSDLPTFNSHAIESQLHHIDGLAEHYLYVNDDVFFGRLSDWHTYFERSGQSRFFESKAGFAAGEPSPDGTSVDNAGKNLQRELFRETGWAPSKKVKHTPHPQQRSLMFEIEQRFGDAYVATKRARFRSTTDISFAAALHHRYGQTVGRVRRGSVDYKYLNLATSNVADRLEKLAGMSFDTLCLNDGAMEAEAFPAVQALVGEFLAARFPYRAPWEVDRGI